MILIRQKRKIEVNTFSLEQLEYIVDNKSKFFTVIFYMVLMVKELKLLIKNI